MSFDLRAKQYNVPTSLMMGTGTELFDFLANCVYEFTKNNKVNMHGLPLGFSFGFPCDQRDIKSGILLEWTKGFSCSGVIGEDVVALLEFALSKIPDLDVNVCAFLNDATGTLLSCAWKVRQCKIGVVLDAGTNICYVERVSHVTKYRGDPNKPFVVINTEYGGMGSDGKIDFVRTGWDKELDDATLNPGSHICEKMISSLYMGELVRRVLVTAIERGIIFRGKLTPQIAAVGAFDTSYLIEISKESMHGRMTRSILAQLGYAMPWSQDCADVQYVCEVVWKRSGDLVAASIAAIINYLNYPEITVAVDGAFYRAHFDYADHITKRLKDFVRSDIQFRCVVADDGSGLGAALAAAATVDLPAAMEEERRMATRITPEIRANRYSYNKPETSLRKEAAYEESWHRDRPPAESYARAREKTPYRSYPADEFTGPRRRQRSRSPEDDWKGPDRGSKTNYNSREGPRRSRERSVSRREHSISGYDPPRNNRSPSGSRSSNSGWRRRYSTNDDYYEEPRSGSRYEESNYSDRRQSRSRRQRRE